MKEEKKTSNPPLEELKRLRRHVAELEQAETERKQAEEEIRLLKEKYEDLYHNAPIMYLSLDTKGIIIECNNTILDKLGYTKREFIGKHMTEFVTEESATRFKKDFPKLLKTGKVLGVERQLVAESGEILDVILDVTMEYDEHGKPIKTRATFEDITARKKAEKELSKHRDHLEELVKGRTAELKEKITECKRAAAELRESEERYRDLFENARDVIVTFDLKGNVTSVNEAVVEYGFKEDEIVGKNMLKFVSKKYWPRLLKELAKIAQGNPIEGEIELVTPKGEKIAEYRSNPIRRGKKVVGLQGILRDITERKRAEEEKLALAEEFKRTIQAKGLQNQIFRYRKRKDGDFVVIFSEGQLAREFNMTTEYVAGKTLLEAVGEDDSSRFYPYYERAFAGETVKYEIEYRGRWFVTTLSSFETLPDGTVAEIIGSVVDITERKQAEQEREQSFKRLQRTLEGTVHALASAVEMRDPYTAGHQRRVTQLAYSIAEEMGLSEDRIEGIHVAGLIHDIGKINLPAEILSKPGLLSDSEFALIKAHPQVGHDILKEIDFPWPVVQIVLQHHERMDGSGYPQGLKGEEILLEARILGVADVVEAMSFHRPYRPARGIDKALEEIAQNKGKLYDSKVVDACLRLFAEDRFHFEE